MSENVWKAKTNGSYYQSHPKPFYRYIAPYKHIKSAQAQQQYLDNKTEEDNDLFHFSLSFQHHYHKSCSRSGSSFNRVISALLISSQTQAQTSPTTPTVTVVNDLDVNHQLVGIMPTYPVVWDISLRLQRFDKQIYCRKDNFVIKGAIIDNSFSSLSGNRRNGTFHK